MATLDEIIGTATGQISSAYGSLEGYIGALGTVIGEWHTVPTPKDFASYDMSGVIPKPGQVEVVTGSPALRDRSSILGQSENAVNGLAGWALAGDPGAYARSIWDTPTATVPVANSPAAAVPVTPMPEAFAQTPRQIEVDAVPTFVFPTLPVAAAYNPSSRLQSLAASLPVAGAPALAHAPLPVVATIQPSPQTLSPSRSVQDNPNLTESALPDAPDLNLPVFNLPPPGVDWSVPSNSFAYVENAYSSDLFNAVRATLLNDVLNGGYGIDPAAEQALAGRARDREAAAYRDSAQGIARGFAARGAPLATDAMATLQWLAHDKMSAAMGDINREIYVKRSDLYIQARQFALQQGVSFESTLLQAHGQEMERRLNASRATADFALQFHRALNEFFQVKLGLWTAISTVQSQQVENAVKGLEAFKLKYLKIDAEDARNKTRLENRRDATDTVRAVEGIRQTELEKIKTDQAYQELLLRQSGQETETFLASDTADKTKLDAWRAANDAVRIMEEIRRTQLEQAQEERQWQELKLRYSTQETANFLAQHTANETAFSAYKTWIEAQVARNQPIQLGLDIYKANVDAAKTSSDIGLTNSQTAKMPAEVAKTWAEIAGDESAVAKTYAEIARTQGDIAKDQFEAALAAHRENQGRYQAQSQHNLAALAWSLDRTRLLADGDNQEALELRRILSAQAGQNNRDRLAVAEMAVREFIGRWQQYLAHLVAVQRSQEGEQGVQVNAAGHALSALGSALSAAESMLLGVASDVTNN